MGKPIELETKFYLHINKKLNEKKSNEKICQQMSRFFAMWQVRVLADTFSGADNRQLFIIAAAREIVI